MPPRRFQAPTGNGAVLADPGFDAVPALVDANRCTLDRADVRVGGLPLGELRALARREVLEAAGGVPSDGPLLVSGHQPELSHPGVWVKNFALNGLARKLGGVPLHLVVDNDTLKSTALRFPVFKDRDPASVHLETVRFDRLDGESPYEHREVIDPDLFRTFPERAAPLWRNWGYTPLLPGVWRDGRNIGEVFTAARRACEQAWGCDNLELPVSRLSQTDAFRRFVVQIFDDLPRFREVYNKAIRAYREANHIRSANHPAPELAAHESPFWELKRGGRRRPAIVSFDLTPRDLRPRALTLTLFARVCLGDFFIHGIGGGKYDEVTDAIVRDYFGIEPPAYQVLSATLHLPLPAFPSTPADVRQAGHRLRDLTWNPQRHLTREATGDPLVLRLLADKVGLASDEPPPGKPAARHEWFRGLQSLTRQLRPHVMDEITEAEAAVARTRAEARANAILQRRDYAWVLYPEATLRPFLQRFLEV